MMTNGKQEVIMRYIIPCVLLLMFVSSALLGQDMGQTNPQSFRSQALGGTIDDDLDLVYDPIELRFVKGVRVYTNLSNLLSGREKILDDQSENEFLLGFSTENPFLPQLSHAVLIRYQNQKYSQPLPFETSTLSIDDTYPNGYFHDIVTEFIEDYPLDGLYDTQYTLDWEETHYDWYKRNGLILNNTLSLSDWTFGFRYSVVHDYFDCTSSSGSFGSGYRMLGGFINDYPSFLINYSIFDVATQEKTFQVVEDGDFLYKSDYLERSFLFSVMKPILGGRLLPIELRADIGYLRHSSITGFDDIYAGRSDNFNADIVDYEDYYTETFSADQEEDYRGYAVYTAFSAKQVFHKSPERRNDGFWSLSAGFLFGAADYDYTSHFLMTGTERFFDGDEEMTEYDYTDYQDLDSTTTDIGTESLGGGFGSARLVLPLGTKVHFGIGLYLSTYTYKRETAYKDSTHGDYSLIYDDIPLTQAGYEGYYYEHWAGDHQYTDRRDGITIPVGIEYRFTRNDRWCIRFGAIFQYTRYTYQDSYEMDTTEPRQYVTEYDDDQHDVDIYSYWYRSYSGQEKQGYSSTTYMYGLGYQPTPHLQIDLLGFFGSYEDHYTGESILDSQFFRQLRLSMTIKF